MCLVTLKDCYKLIPCYVLVLDKLKKVWLRLQRLAILLREALRDRFLAPLEYQKERGWHYSDPNWRLPSISLSQEELFALTLGARMLEAYAGNAYVEELRSAIAFF